MRGEINMSLTALKINRYRPSQSKCFLARRAFAASLVAVFTACSAAAGGPPSPQGDQEKTPTVRERLQALPPHTTIQVKLHDKKIRGHLSVVTRKGFVIQITAGGKTKNEKISYDDVQSIDAIEETGKGNKVSIHVVVDNGSGSGVDVQIDH
jgi:hypothetical protein